jgi:hypothetical protein
VVTQATFIMPASGTAPRGAQFCATALTADTILCIPVLWKGTVFLGKGMDSIDWSPQATKVLATVVRCDAATLAVLTSSNHRTETSVNSSSRAPSLATTPWFCERDALRADR